MRLRVGASQVALPRLVQVPMVASQPGAAAGPSAVACHAEKPFVNGPITVNLGAADYPAEGKTKQPLDRSKGLWTRCDKCGVILYIKHLKVGGRAHVRSRLQLAGEYTSRQHWTPANCPQEHHHICFGCNYHLKMSSQERIDHLIDAGTWRPLDETLSPVDPLEFTDMKVRYSSTSVAASPDGVAPACAACVTPPCKRCHARAQHASTIRCCHLQAYTDRIREAQDKTGLQDAVRTGTGLLHGIPVALGVMDFGYMGGSMGSVVGEKLTRLIEYATQEGMALMIVCTSGGARMQEGIMSLMQVRACVCVRVCVCV